MNIQVRTDHPGRLHVGVRWALGLPLLLCVAGCCPEAPAGVAPASATTRRVDLDNAVKLIIVLWMLPSGTPAPAFNLTDQDGNAFTNDDLRGSITAIGFIYTSCPDVCGLLTASFLDIGEKFEPAITDKSLRLVLITTDPERDTPERIKTFTRAHGGKWSFLTADMETCEEVWEAYGVNRTYNPSADYVYHTYKILLLDHEANLRFDFVGLDDPEADLVRDLTQLLGES